jgi:putative heme transporter
MQPEPAEFVLPQLDLRVLARRAAVPAALVAVAALVVIGGGRLREFANALDRALTADWRWVVGAVVFEVLSFAGYVVLLWLVAGRETRRIDPRRAVEVTLGGAAATRLLPTAGVGGAAMTLWSFRRAGMDKRTSARTLLTFLVLLYAVFLGAIAISGGLIALGVIHADGPLTLSAVPAIAAAAGIAAVLALGLHRRGHAGDGVLTVGLHRRGRAGDGVLTVGPHRRGHARDGVLTVGPHRRGHARDGVQPAGRLRRGVHLLGDATADAIALLRTADPRLLGAVAWWLFDAAVLGAMLSAFGAAPAVPVVVLAYFVGQVGNALPVPGAVSGGILGVLLAFGVQPDVALVSVLVYRSVAIWLPAPVGLIALTSLRRTIARWASEDASAPARA